MVVSDIDGTLIPIGGTMSERTQGAIKECARRGIAFIPASGRSFDGAAKVFRRLNIDCPVISCNGGRADAHTYPSPIFEDTLESDDSLFVHKRLIEAGCFMTSYVGTEVYMLPEINGYGSKCAGISEAKQGERFDYEAEKEKMRVLGTVKPYKYEAYSDDKALLDALRSEFLARGLSVSSAFPFNLEIMAPGAGKGKMVERFIKHFGIERQNVMAMGDGSNDITLLRAAGMPVAMENAVDSLKQAAKIIAPPADRDGAAQILKQYVLSENNI